MGAQSIAVLPRARPFGRLTFCAATYDFRSTRISIYFFFFEEGSASPRCGPRAPSLLMPLSAFSLAPNAVYVNVRFRAGRHASFHASGLRLSFMPLAFCLTREAGRYGRTRWLTWLVVTDKPFLSDRSRRGIEVPPHLRSWDSRARREVFSR